MRPTMTRFILVLLTSAITACGGDGGSSPATKTELEGRWQPINDFDQSGSSATSMVEYRYNRMHIRGEIYKSSRKENKYLESDVVLNFSIEGDTKLSSGEDAKKIVLDGYATRFYMTFFDDSLIAAIKKDNFCKTQLSTIQPGRSYDLTECIDELPAPLKQSLNTFTNKKIKRVYILKDNKMFISDTLKDTDLDADGFPTTIKNRDNHYIKR